jgi:hypothetical protein
MVQVDERVEISPLAESPDDALQPSTRSATANWSCVHARLFQIESRTVNSESKQGLMINCLGPQ